MPFTGKAGSVDSRPGNLVPGFGSRKFIPTLTDVNPAQLVVEVAFANNPIDTAGYFNTLLADNPVAYWRMDNAALLPDWAGLGNTMTVVGSPTLVASALSGDTNQATLFNGTTQSASAPDSASLDLTGAMAMEFWLQFAAVPGATAPVGGKGRAYWVELRTDGKLQFSVRAGSTVTTVVSTTVLTTGTWFHVGIAYDGANLRIHLNGNATPDATTAYTGAIDTTPTPFSIASLYDSTSSPVWRDRAFASSSGLGSTIGSQAPPACQVGDYIVATMRATSNTIQAAPSGWTFLGQTSSGSYMQFAYGKVADANDVGAGAVTHVWTFGTAQSSFSLVMAAFSNCSGVGVVASNRTAGTPCAVNLTPAFNNTTIFAAFVQSSGAYGAITPGTVQYNGFLAGEIAGETTTVGASTLTTSSAAAAGASAMSVIAVELVGPLGLSSRSAIRVDEWSVWNTALTGAQNAAHFAAASVTPTVINWTDISSDVRSCQISRGRQYELDEMQAGTAQLVLKDDARKYDTGNDLSPYAPVLPLRMIRIRALFNSVYYPLFRGYVERWESSWETDYARRYAEVNVSCVDGFEPLNLAVVTGNVPGGPIGIGISALLGKANQSPLMRAIDVGAFPINAFALDGTTSILGYILPLASGEGGLFFHDAAGLATFHDHNHRYTATRSTVSQATFGDVPDGSLPYTAVDSPGKAKDRIVNDWHVSDELSADHAASDATSITTYFRRTDSRSTRLLAGDAATMAAWLLARTKDPGYRFDGLELTPYRSLEVWMQALQGEISDRYTVQAQPVGTVPGSQIAKDLWIEKVDWDIRVDRPWKVKWQLSPAV